MAQDFKVGQVNFHVDNNETFTVGKANWHTEAVDLVTKLMKDIEIPEVIEVSEVKLQPTPKAAISGEGVDEIKSIIKGRA